MKTKRMICLMSMMTWHLEKEAEMAFTFRVMSMITCIITHFHLNTSCRWRKKTMMEPFLCYKVHKEVSYNCVKMMHNTVQFQEMSSMSILRVGLHGSTLLHAYYRPSKWLRTIYTRMTFSLTKINLLSTFREMTSCESVNNFVRQFETRKLHLNSLILSRNLLQNMSFSIDFGHDCCCILKYVLKSYNIFFLMYITVISEW